MCVGCGIHGGEGEVSATQFGCCCGKCIGLVVAVESRVAPDFEEGGGSVEAGTVHDALAEEFKGRAVTVVGVLARGEKLFMYLEQAAEAVAEDGNRFVVGDDVSEGT